MAKILLPDKLVPVFMGTADVRGAYGGRGSAKSRSFAKMTAVRALIWESQGRDGVIVCGREYFSTIEDSSMAEVKAAIESEPEILLPHFTIGSKFIQTKSGRISYKFSGLSGRTIEGIKSTSNILLLWADEAEDIIEDSWRIIEPTIRGVDSELWVTWNPRRKGSATDLRYRQRKDDRYKVVEMNWRDNPWWPETLERQRLRAKKEDPENYEHVWEGAYATASKSAYFIAQINEMKASGRVLPLEPSKMLRRKFFADIGGAGRSSDAFAGWGCQFVNVMVDTLDYYESVGQSADYHVSWLRQRGYMSYNTDIFLPHDGATSDKVFATSYQSYFTEAGYSTIVIPNQGRGAAAARIRASRIILPFTRMNEGTTLAGLEALAWYHEKWCNQRNIGLGPEHDWASHAADAFGLMAIVAIDAGIGSPGEVAGVRSSGRKPRASRARRSRLTAMSV